MSHPYRDYYSAGLFPNPSADEREVVEGRELRTPFSDFFKLLIADIKHYSEKPFTESSLTNKIML